MKRSIHLWILSIALLASGCGIRVRMDYWVGRSAEQLLREEGEPRVVMEFPDGSRAYRYWGEYNQVVIKSENAIKALCVGDQTDMWDSSGCMLEHAFSSEYQNWRKGRVDDGSDYEITDHRTYYITPEKRIIGWIYREKRAGWPLQYRYGPKTAEGFCAVRNYLELERRWLLEQGNQNNDPRGKLRADIFDQETEPLKEVDSSPVTDFMVEDIPEGVYRAGKGLEGLFRSEEDEAEPTPNPPSSVGP